MADRENDDAEREETAEEPRAKKFKYTSKAKAAPEKAKEPEPEEKKRAPATARDEDEEEEESDDEDDDSSDDDADEPSDDESEDSDEEAGDDEEEKPVEPKENRAQRRKNKKVKPGAEPKDRNEKVRKQLLKKKLAAEEEPEALTAGEMVDDAFARGMAAAGKWLQKNSAAVQYVVLAGLLGAVGFGVYTWHAGSKAEEASGLLAKAVYADRGVVDADPPPRKPGEEEVIKVYKTSQERVDAALADYKRAGAASNGTGAAILARLGEAGLLLDAKKWDEAATAYRDVKSSALATADVDVKGRALEGIGFALEGKGDSGAALGAFKELESLNGRGFKELGLYHQARIHAQKGEKEKATELVKAARERIKTDPRGFSYLEGVLEELSRALDPNAGSKASKAGGGMGLEQIMKLQEMMQKSQGDE